ncbi:hypothetical protein SeMB42_g07859 [Synchytrium endobioticum]|uniref:Uncharacterized protein n=1 Tax=Synchytrium endobioticum TaxID=286115 RepID=A0A507BT67_9FUNG|nr:hypothetical protein SeMB42_g07859 [Synchytrium endobioticum]
MKPIMMNNVIAIVVLQATILYYLVSAGVCFSGGDGDLRCANEASIALRDQINNLRFALRTYPIRDRAVFNSAAAAANAATERLRTLNTQLQANRVGDRAALRSTVAASEDEAERLRTLNQLLQANRARDRATLRSAVVAAQAAIDDLRTLNTQLQDYRVGDRAVANLADPFAWGNSQGSASSDSPVDVCIVCTTLLTVIRMKR